VAHVPPTLRRLTHDPKRIEKLLNKRWKAFHTYRDRQNLSEEQEWEQNAAPLKAMSEYVLKKTVFLNEKLRLHEEERSSDSIGSKRRRQFSLNALTMAACIIEEFIKDEISCVIIKRRIADDKLDNLPPFRFENVEPYPLPDISK